MRLRNHTNPEKCPFCFTDHPGRLRCSRCGKEFSSPEKSAYLRDGTYLMYGREMFYVGTVLGQGGFGITYLAWDFLQMKKVVIKEFFPEEYCRRDSDFSVRITVDEGYREQFDTGMHRFLQEGAVMRAVSGIPGIVKILNTFQLNGTAYIIMDYIDGLTLAEKVTQEGPMTMKKAAEILFPVFDTVTQLHEKGFIHRDLSPENIKMDRAGQLILLDYGSARQYEEDKTGRYTVFVRSGYSPIEQYEKESVQNEASDVYALGAILYWMVTGTEPIDSTSRILFDMQMEPSYYNYEISHDQDFVVMKALSMDPSLRYPSAADFRCALEGVL